MALPARAPNSVMVKVLACGSGGRAFESSSGSNFSPDIFFLLYEIINCWFIKQIDSGFNLKLLNIKWKKHNAYHVYLLFFVQK